MGFNLIGMDVCSNQNGWSDYEYVVITMGYGVVVWGVCFISLTFKWWCIKQQSNKQSVHFYNNVHAGMYTYMNRT